VSRGRILVIRGGAIGDFILTLPAIAALRKQFPQTHIAVLGYPHIASLAQLAGSANEVRSIEARALAGFFAKHGELDRALGDWFGGFNIIVSYLYDPDEIFQENVARVSKAQFIAGPHRPDEAAARHATEVFLKPLERLAIFGMDTVPRLNLVPKRQQDVGGMLAIHPGSGSEKKNWPEERWQELLRLIQKEKSWRVLLVGGEAEGERLQRLASILPIERLAVALNKPLPELAQTLVRCGAFLGHDSGITHLAAAVEVPGVALWGGTNEHIWRPLGPAFTLLRDEHGLEHLEPNRVLGAVTDIMK
jgi:ADP-heptose:LPS heptosyltransferase